nr:RNA polymerase [Flumine tombus-like virus 31]
MERVFLVPTGDTLLPPPVPIPHAFDRLNDFTTQLLHEVKPAVPSTYSEFLGLYAGDRRQKAYATAVESLKLDPVKEKDSFISAFGKAEKFTKEDPAMRLIQPRSLRYNTEVGRYLKRLEKQVYKDIAKVFKEVTVLKGYNATDTATILKRKWDRFKNPIAIGTDASRFDQHVSVQALKWEHSVYLKYFYPSDRNKLRELLSWQLVNRGIAKATDGHIKYKVDGCRMSGDMNTSLGNCLLMCAMFYAYLKHIGVDAELANNGDDCIIICEKREFAKLSSLPTWFREMGFTMKVEDPVDVFEEIQFCQTQPIYLGDDGWIMCRDVRVALAKDASTFLPIDRKQVYYQYLKSIGDCGLSLTGGIPIFQEFYLTFLRYGANKGIGKHPAMETGFARLAHGMSRVAVHITDETRISFWKAFGILPSTQILLENKISQANLTYNVPIHRENIPEFSLIISNDYF